MRLSRQQRRSRYDDLHFAQSGQDLRKRDRAACGADPADPRCRCADERCSAGKLQHGRGRLSAAGAVPGTHGCDPDHRRRWHHPARSKSFAPVRKAHPRHQSGTLRFSGHLRDRRNGNKAGRRGTWRVSAGQPDAFICPGAWSGWLGRSCPQRCSCDQGALAAGHRLQHLLR